GSVVVERRRSLKVGLRLLGDLVGGEPGERVTRRRRTGGQGKRPTGGTCGDDGRRPQPTGTTERPWNPGWYIRAADDPRVQAQQAAGAVVAGPGCPPSNPASEVTGRSPAFRW